MVAVILAGGMGTRLSNYIKDIPKPMVQIEGKPVLEYQIENLSRCGITEIILVIGYLGQVIKDYFGDGHRFGVNLTYFEEEQPLGTAGAFFYLKDRLTEDFLVIYGDIIFDLDFQQLITFHQQYQALITLTVHPNNHPFDSDLIEVDERNLVRGILKKNVPRDFFYHNCVNSGIYMLGQPVAGMIVENKKQDLEKDIIQAVIPGGRVYAYKTPEYIKDMGTPERCQLVREHVRKGIVRQRNLSNLQKAIFLDRDGTINQFVGLLVKPEQLAISDEVYEALGLINNSGYLSIVITNQPVVARNLCSIEELDHIHRKLETELGKRNVYVDDLYYCPHHPDSGYPEENKLYKIECGCRKPKTGMIEKAVARYHIDLAQSYLIGDSTADIQTGKNAHLKTILLATGQGGKDQKYDAQPDFCANNLLDAVQLILQ
jgi:D,D-heptose 1,7-bisphosphate phosphatase